MVRRGPWRATLTRGRRDIPHSEKQEIVSGERAQVLEPLCAAAAPVQEARRGLAVRVLGRGLLDVVGVDEASAGGEELCRGIGASAGKGACDGGLTRWAQKLAVIALGCRKERVLLGANGVD